MDLTVIKYLPAKRWYIVPTQSIKQDSLHRNQLGFHLNQQSVYSNKINIKAQDIYNFDTINLAGETICINQKSKPVIFKYSYPDKETTDKILKYYQGFIEAKNKDQFGMLYRFEKDTARIRILKGGDAIAELFANDIE